MSIQLKVLCVCCELCVAQKKRERERNWHLGAVGNDNEGGERRERERERERKGWSQLWHQWSSLIKKPSSFLENKCVMQAERWRTDRTESGEWGGVIWPDAYVSHCISFPVCFSFVSRVSYRSFPGYSWAEQREAQLLCVHQVNARKYLHSACLSDSVLVA